MTPRRELACATDWVQVCGLGSGVPLAILHFPWAHVYWGRIPLLTGGWRTKGKNENTQTRLWSLLFLHPSCPIG